MIRELWAALGRPAKAGESARSPGSAGQKTVLIIDDDRESLHAMCLALAGEAYRVQPARGAEPAIGKPPFHPALILLDTQVEDANGARLARRLFADEELASVPIIALREKVAGEEGRLEPYGQFDGQIAKPVDTRTFARQVRAFLDSSEAPAPRPADVTFTLTAAPDRRRQAAGLLEGIESGLPDSQFARGTRTALHQLAEIVGGAPYHGLADYLREAERFSNVTTARARYRFRAVIRLCRELVDRGPEPAPGIEDLRADYLDHRRAELNALDCALRAADWSTLRKAGHNLKGTGSAYGFAEVTDIGRALEAAAKEADGTAIEALLDRIEAYIGIVQLSSDHRGNHATGI